MIRNAATAELLPQQPLRLLDLCCLGSFPDNFGDSESTTAQLYLRRAAQAADGLGSKSCRGRNAVVPNPTIAEVEQTSRALRNEDEEDEVQLQAQLSRWLDRTRLRCLKIKLQDKGAWQQRARIEDACLAQATFSF